MSHQQRETEIAGPDRVQVHLTEAEAQALCLEWQKILRLSDWDVRVRVRRKDTIELQGDDIQGRCYWTVTRREATIILLDPVDFPPSCTFPQDMEATLVHELLHLHGAGFDEFKVGDAQDRALEQMIHATSYALVELKRAACNSVTSP